MRDFTKFFFNLLFFIQVARTEDSIRGVIEEEILENKNLINDNSIYNITKELSNIITKNVEIIVSVADFRNLNKEFLVIDLGDENSQKKENYYNSYNGLIKENSYDIRNFEMNVKNIEVKLANETNLQIKFVKNLAMTSTYFQTKISLNAFIDQFFKSYYVSFYDFHVFIEENSTEYQGSNNFFVLNDSNKIESLNVSENSKELYELNFLGDNFISLARDKIYIQTKINECLFKLLSHEFSNANLRNYLKNYEIIEVSNLINQIKRKVLYLTNENQINLEVYSTLDNEIDSLVTYLSTFKIQGIINITLPFIFYILIISLILISMVFSTLKEITEFYRKKLN